MKVKTSGTLWTAVLFVVMVVGQWIDDRYFQSGFRDWFPKFLNSAQAIGVAVVGAIGLAITVWGEASRPKPEIGEDSVNWTQAPDEPGTRSVNWTGPAELPLWRRIL